MDNKSNSELLWIEQVPELKTTAMIYSENPDARIDLESDLRAYCGEHAEAMIREVRLFALFYGIASRIKKLTPETFDRDKGQVLDFVRDFSKDREVHTCCVCGQSEYCKEAYCDFRKGENCHGSCLIYKKG